MTERIECEQVDERLEAYLDGGLPPEVASEVAGHLEHCGACRRELAMAERIRTTLRSQRLPACPPGVEDSLERMPARRRWLPAGITGAVAASVLAVAVTWQATGPRPDTPSPTELADARQDLELALGYIGKAGRIAGRDVGNVVTRAGMMEPIQDGMRLKLTLPAPDSARSKQAES